MPIGRQNRREFIKAAARGVAGAAALKALGGRGQQPAPVESPNVLFVFSDQHRAASMPGQPFSEVVAPNLERLGREGVTFSHCVSCYPLCSPYRAMLLSGRWPYETGVIDNDMLLRDDGTSIGHTFSRAGYLTGYIGKWHLCGAAEGPPVQACGYHGWDYSCVWHDTNAHENASWYFGPKAHVEKPKGYNATLMTDMAIDFIQANAARPWCLFLSLNPPHPKFVDAPAAQKARYDPEALVWRPNVPHLTRPSSVLRADCQGYQAHVTAVDAEVARLLQALDTLGLSDKTLVVYTSDHGEMMGSQGRMGKRLPFEESCRVPFIARWPGALPAGLERDTLLSPVDLYPSLCALTGLSVPAVCQGRDLSAAFRGQKIDEPESTILMHIDKANLALDEEHPAPVFRGVRTTRYTYAEHSGGPWLLFDNQEDPYQEHNLVTSPAQASLRGDLRGLLGEWLYRAGDRFELNA